MVVETKFTSSARGNSFLPFNQKEEQEWRGDFTFIQAADTQFGMQESYIEKKEDFGWDQEIKWSRQLVNKVNTMSPRPRFMVICGDLLDAWPETQGEIRNKQEKDFKNVFSDLQVPCVCVCGNHDIGNQPSMESVSRYRSSFGDDFFSFWCGGVYFLVINTQYYEDSSRVPKLAAEQENWLDQQLETIKERQPKHAVVFQHIPFFLNHPDEEKEYFNFKPDLRHKMLNKFYDAGVRHVFAGHYHRNAGGMFKDMQQVVTSAVGAQLGGDEQGYRVVQVTEKGLNHEYRTLSINVSLPPVIAFNLLMDVLDTIQKDDHGDGETPIFKPLAGRQLRAA